VRVGDDHVSGSVADEAGNAPEHHRRRTVERADL
jgi:hypothetical protein